MVKPSKDAKCVNTAMLCKKILIQFATTPQLHLKVYIRGLGLLIALFNV